MSPYEEVAVVFAKALVDGDFSRAHCMLAPHLQAELSPAALHDCLHGMFRGYADGPPAEVQYDPEFAMTEWPTKQPGDVGWAYVGILGQDFVEAVTVVVQDLDGVLLIRNVEWGRP